MTVDLGGGEAVEVVFVESLDAYVGKYEVTNGQYRRFRPEHDSGAYDGRTLNLDRQPAVRVSLEDARAFCRWMRQCSGIAAGYRPRLPTGSEWTCLAHCGDGRLYPWGNRWPPLSGNYSDITADRELDWDGHMIEGYDDGAAVTCRVEESGDNAWGLFGLGGNVWEWTEEPARNETWRVLRGASWRYKEKAHLRCNYREKQGAPWGQDNNVGFRVVLSR